MTDLLKGLTGGWGLSLHVWMFPCALFVGALWIFVYPEVSDLEVMANIKDLSTTEKGGVSGVIVVFLGLVLMSLSTPLYRLLEGYSWPNRLKEWGVKRHSKKKQALKNTPEGEGWERGLLLEKLSRFPLDDRQIAPTRLGNAIRAFETYGKTRFNLDSQTMWSELCTVAPKYLQTELNQARAGVDYFVALFYLSTLFGVLALLAMTQTVGINWALVISIVAAFTSMLFWYRMAVLSSSYWSATVQALVNLGRKNLADSMGLQIPKTIDEERDMWAAVTKFVYYGHRDTTGGELDKFNKNP